MMYVVDQDFFTTFNNHYFNRILVADPTGIR